MDEGNEGDRTRSGAGLAGGPGSKGVPIPGDTNGAGRGRRPARDPAMRPVDPAINRVVSARSMGGERDRSPRPTGDGAAPAPGDSGTPGGGPGGAGGAGRGGAPSAESREHGAGREPGGPSGGAPSAESREHGAGREPGEASAGSEPGRDGLRARIQRLEALLDAGRALAATTHDAGARRAICDRVAAVLGCDVVAIIESDPEAGTVTIAGSSGADLDGRAVAAERAALSAAALGGAEPELIGDLGQRSAAEAWPLQQAGCAAGAWQPIGRAAGVSSLIAAGWHGAPEGSGAELLAALAELAAAAALALDRAAAIAELTEMARTDPLTEVANRRSWEDELQRELARADRLGEPVAVGLLDLDDLKSFNDRWGHAAGDRLLLTAAARWRRRLRVTDVLARMGGDEFGVILPGCGIEQAASLGDQLRRVMPEGLSCSIGVAEWVPGETAAALLARADEALYAAKRAGRDATFVMRPTARGPVEGSVP